MAELQPELANLAPGMHMINSQQFARGLDEADELRGWRSSFLFPKHGDQDVVYLTGNSLGLQPVGVKQALIQELDDWQALGVEGHLKAKNPWFSYHERFTEGAAKLVGALPSEVVVMNQLTVNLQLLLVSFYRPSGRRKKILFETKPFPSDQYAFESQAKWHGLDPNEVLVEMKPRSGEWTLRTEDIEEQIAALGEELALVCFGGVNYFTGQFFNLERIAAAAHRVGARCGFDLAHTAGNLPLHLHDWGVDFACWCTYKYLNSGPGSVGGVFIHERHVTNPELIRLAGWWGHDKASRFQMEPHFNAIPTAESWQLSNAPVMSMAVHKVALDIFTEVGMEKLRKKSILLTAFLEFLLTQVGEATGQSMEVITPSDPEQRGAQLSVILPGRSFDFVDKLLQHGVVVDWREPNVIRMAPVPLYNSFEDVYRFAQALELVLKN